MSISEISYASFEASSSEEGSCQEKVLVLMERLNKYGRKIHDIVEQLNRYDSSWWVSFQPSWIDCASSFFGDQDSLLGKSPLIEEKMKQIWNQLEEYRPRIEVAKKMDPTYTVLGDILRSGGTFEMIPEGGVSGSYFLVDGEGQKRI